MLPEPIHPLPGRVSPQNFPPVLRFFRQLGEGWKWFSNGSCHKTYNYRMCYSEHHNEVFAEIKYPLALFGDKWCVLYPISPTWAKRAFWHNSGSPLFPRHPVGWLQQVASTSLKNQADAEHSLVSKPSTGQWHDQLIYFLKTSRWADILSHKEAETVPRNEPI